MTFEVKYNFHKLTALIDNWLDIVSFLRSYRVTELQDVEELTVLTKYVLKKQACTFIVQCTCLYSIN